MKIVKAFFNVLKNVLLLFSCFLIVLAATGAIIYAVPLKRPEVTPDKRSIFLSDVNILDVENESIRENQNVLIVDGVIHKISPSLNPNDFPESKQIDGSNKYLMPGLWDMHTHSLKMSPYIHHPLFIRFGVTSVRDMSGCLNQDDSYWACPKDRRKWTQQAAEALAVSPTYHLESSYQTNGGNEVPENFPDYFRLKTESDAALLVNFYKEQGVSFIKTYSELSVDQFTWLAKNSAAGNMGIAGHKPLRVPLELALEKNMMSIEHGRLFAFECYTKIAQFRELPDPIRSYTSSKIRDIVNNQDNSKCAQLMSRVADSNTAWVPTLTTLKMSADSRSVSLQNDDRLDYIPLIVRKLIWEPDVNRAAEKGFDDQGAFVHLDYYSLVQKHIKESHEKGVRILVGTDNIDSMVFSGLSVHEEMQNLAAAGLPTSKALLAATLWPAQFSGVDSMLGSVAEGKRADLVLLRANPLDDIKNTLTIEAVLKNGYYYSHKNIYALEEYTLSMAQSIQLNLKLFLQMLLSPLMRVQLAD